MDYLRRMQMERPVLFCVVLFVAIFVAFQLLLFVAGLILGPFGLPSWAPLARPRRPGRRRAPTAAIAVDERAGRGPRQDLACRGPRDSSGRMWR